MTDDERDRDVADATPPSPAPDDERLIDAGEVSERRRRGALGYWWHRLTRHPARDCDHYLCGASLADAYGDLRDKYERGVLSYEDVEAIILGSGGTRADVRQFLGPRPT